MNHNKSVTHINIKLNSPSTDKERNILGGPNRGSTSETRGQDNTREKNRVIPMCADLTRTQTRGARARYLCGMEPVVSRLCACVER